MIIQEWFHDLAALITKKHLFSVATALFLFFLGLFIAKRASLALTKLPQLDPQQRLLLGKISYYALVTVAVAAALGQLGFDLKVLLGAAGVLTVAIGFAAQTSMSNLISGLFLMVDRPFVVGDTVAIGDLRGEVLAIDLLSCKIRTFNNLLVRIPNETMVKSNLTNYSFFPVRRLDLSMGVSYSTSIDIVETVLRQTAAAHPLCLDEPRPVFVVSGFGDSSINIQLQVWTLAENLATLQNELYRDIKNAFERAGIKAPPPATAAATTNA